MFMVTLFRIITYNFVGHQIKTTTLIRSRYSFQFFLLCKKSHVTHLTPYFERRSLDKGAAISFLLMCDGAVKWRLRCFLEEDETFLFNFILDLGMDLKSKNLSQFCMSCSAIQRSARSCGESFCNDSGTTGQQNF